MSQPMNNKKGSAFPPKGFLHVDNFSKTYGETERIRHKREDVDPEIAKELFKGNMKNQKWVTSESKVTTFDAVDHTGKSIKISAVDIKYTLGPNAVLVKASGKIYTGAEAHMRYNMIPDMKISGQGYDKTYEAPKVIPAEKFSYSE